MSRFNEFYGGSAPTARSTGALGAVKLRNQIHAIDPKLTVDLKNIRVNGAPQGCSGFVSDGHGHYVYVSADRNHGTNTDALCRTASGPKDYSGGRNHITSYDELAQAAVDLLKAS